MKHVKGFTLIELMITVLIAGILASIAIPFYMDYVVKGNRTAAQSFMRQVENTQKQYLLDARTYAGDLNTLGTAAPPDVAKFYDITIATSAVPPGFTITATAKNGTRQFNDGNLTLDSNGVKTPADKW